MESVYELHKRESHGFSPSLPHHLDHEVSLQGAGRRVAGADTNDYPAGLQGTRRPDRLRRFVAGTCPYVRGNLAASCRQRLRAARQGTLIASGADGVPGPAQSAPGGDISGLGATSPPRAATSRTMSYFSIFGSTNLPAPAGSYSVETLHLSFAASKRLMRILRSIVGMQSVLAHILKRRGRLPGRGAHTGEQAPALVLAVLFMSEDRCCRAQGRSIRPVRTRPQIAIDAGFIMPLFDSAQGMGLCAALSRCQIVHVESRRAGTPTKYEIKIVSPGASKNAAA
jgi:hypothetical protein